MSCQQQHCLEEAVTAAASSVCDGDSSVWWIQPECHSGLSSQEVAVAFQSALRQGHARTHTHTLHSLSNTHSQPVCLSIYYKHICALSYRHTCVSTQTHTCSHTYTGFQALAVIQAQFLPCKYSSSPGLLFITLQCYSVASARNACLALFRPPCNIHGARSPGSCLLGLSIAMLGLAIYHKAHWTALLVQLACVKWPSASQARGPIREARVVCMQYGWLTSSFQCKCQMQKCMCCVILSVETQLTVDVTEMSFHHNVCLKWVSVFNVNGMLLDNWFRRLTRKKKCISGEKNMSCALSACAVCWARIMLAGSFATISCERVFCHAALLPRATSRWLLQFCMRWERRTVQEWGRRTEGKRCLLIGNNITTDIVISSEWDSFHN